MAIRLIKVAKELNIGTSTIVECLRDHGHIIVNKPTEKISNEQYLILKNTLNKEGQKSIESKLKLVDYSDLNSLSRFEPENVIELCEDFNISFVQFLVLSKNIDFGSPISHDLVLNQSEVETIRIALLKSLSNEKKLLADSKIERGTLIEGIVKEISFPSGIIIEFPANYTGFLTLSHAGTNIIESELFIQNSKIGDRIECVVYDIDPISEICYLSRKLHPNSYSKSKFEIGDVLRANPVEELQNKTIVNLEGKGFGLVSKDLDSLYKIAHYDAENGLFHLAKIEDKNDEILELNESNDITLIEPYLSSYENFIFSNLGACASAEEREVLKESYKWIPELFSKSLRFESPLRIRFKNNHSWQSFLNDVGGEKNIISGFELLQKEKFWVSVFSQSNEYIVLYNENYFLKIEVIEEDKEQKIYLIDNFSSKRSNKSVTRSKSIATDNGSLDCNIQIILKDPWSNFIPNVADIKIYKYIKAKFACSKILRDLKIKAGELLKYEGKNLATYQAFLEFQINKTGEKQLDPIPIISFKQLPSDNIKLRYSLELDEQLSDDISFVEICQRLGSQNKDRTFRFKTFVSGNIESRDNNSLIISLANTFPSTINNLYLKPKHSTSHLEIQKKLISDFFRGKIDISHIEKILLDHKSLKRARIKEIALVNEDLQKTEIEKPDNKQIEAVKKGVGNRNILLIQGPPGTGKTTVIAEIINHLLLAGEKILVSSQGHVAVDNVLEKFSKRSDLLFTRIGNEDKISNESKNFHIQRILNNYIQIYKVFLKNQKTIILDDNISKSEIHDLSKEYPDFLRSTFKNCHFEVFNAGFNKDTLKHTHQILQEWEQTLSDQFSDLAKPLIYKQLDIVFGTCLGLKNYKDFDKYGVRFNTLILDEAGKANLAESIVAMSLADKVILVGDQKQLPPYLDSSLIDPKDPNSFTNSGKYKLDPNLLKQSLSTSFFEFLYNKIKEGKFPKDNLVMLNLQHRMHPTIGSLVSESFYNSSVDNGANTINNQIRLDAPLDKEIVFLDTSNDKNPFEKRIASEQSYINELEAHYIANEIIPRLKDGGLAESQYAVIAPYKSQVNLIKKLVNNPNVQIETLDSFQGKEFDVIIISFTRSKFRSKVGFLDDARRLNVAFSRAKKKLILIGNTKTLTDSNCHFDLLFNYTRFFKKVVDICNTKGKLFQIKNYTEYKIAFSNKSEIKIGETYDGVISKVEIYGAFINIGKRSGLLHKSKISGKEWKDLKSGKTSNFKVKVLSIDSRGKLEFGSSKPINQFLICQYHSEDKQYFKVLISGGEKGLILKNKKSVRRLKANHGLPIGDMIFKVLDTGEMIGKLKLLELL